MKDCLKDFLDRAENDKLRASDILLITLFIFSGVVVIVSLLGSALAFFVIPIVAIATNSASKFLWLLPDILLFASCAAITIYAWIRLNNLL